MYYGYFSGGIYSQNLGKKKSRWHNDLNTTGDNMGQMETFSTSA
jgi:hypothetical protein